MGIVLAFFFLPNFYPTYTHTVHIIGEIEGCKWIKDREDLYCKWKIVDDLGNSKVANKWHLLRGTKEGTTQIASSRGNSAALWNHPIDVHYSVSSLIGWPRFYLEVWHIDQFDRHQLVGNGMCYVPTEDGEHRIDCVHWRPVGSEYSQFADRFLGSTSQLSDSSVVFSCSDKFPLRTESAGVVFLHLYVLSKGFKSTGNISFTEK